MYMYTYEQACICILYLCCTLTIVLIRVNINGYTFALNTKCICQMQSETTLYIYIYRDVYTCTFVLTYISKYCKSVLTHSYRFFKTIVNTQLVGLRENYRKLPYFMGKSMVSCRFSLKSTHWNTHWHSSEAGPQRGRHFVQRLHQRLREGPKKSRGAGALVGQPGGA